MSGYVAPRDVAEAERRQRELRGRLDLANALTSTPDSVIGLDVSYDIDSTRVAAAAVVIDVATLAVRECRIAYGEASFPYVPGLLAFREVPVLLDALSMVTVRPEVLVCDGYGIAHPRGLGLASHLGVLTGLPSFGVAKTPFLATFASPGPQRGDWTPLVDGATTVGRALRTQAGVKPVFVSVGHRIGLVEAADLTLHLCGRYRLPEATRQADLRSRQALKIGGADPRT